MKTKIIYKCSNCGNESVKWSAKCFECGTFGTIEEAEAPAKTSYVSTSVKSIKQSRNITSEITKLAKDSTDVAVRAGALLTQLVPNIQHTAELVQEISASSQEQSAGAAQVNNALQQLDQTIQQNASASEELASTAEELSGQSEQLRSTIAFFWAATIRSP